MTVEPPASPTPELVSGVRFSGPANLLAQWDRFTRLYTHEGTTGVADVNALNDIAFSDRADRAAITTFSTAAQQTQKALHRAAHALGQLSKDLEYRPLHHAVVDVLVDQWVALERSAGLYPPVAITNRTKWADREHIGDRRRKLLSTTEGSMIAGALNMLSDRIIHAEASRIAVRYNLDLDDVLTVGQDLFHKALFAYSADGGAGFLTFLANGLSTRPQKYAHQLGSHRELSLDAETGDRKPIALQLAVEDPTVSFAQNIASEYVERLPALLNQLPDNCKKTLRLRFGLDGRGKRTQTEVGEALGVGKQRAEQLEKKALALLAEAYARDAAKRVKSSSRLSDENRPGIER